MLQQTAEWWLKSVSGHPSLALNGDFMAFYVDPSASTAVRSSHNAVHIYCDKLPNDNHGYFNLALPLDGAFQSVQHVMIYALQ